MGYRHSLYIIEKETVDALTSEEIKKMEDLSRYDIWKKLGGQEILELGKYSDEGFELGQNGIKVNGILEEFRSIMFEEGDTEFEFLEPEKLVWLSEKYLERTIRYWEMLISNEPQEIGINITTEPGEKCINYVRDLLRWKKFMLNTDKEPFYFSCKNFHSFAVKNFYIVLQG